MAPPLGARAETPSPVPWCALVPLWTVRSVLGEDVGPPVEARTVPGGTTCTYAVGANSLAVQLTFLTLAYSAFQAVENDYLKTGALRVDGIGQAAFAVASGNGDYENLYFYGNGLNIGISAAAPLPRLEVLAKLLLAKL
jgi:hypothetical protein